MALQADAFGVRAVRKIWRPTAARSFFQCEEGYCSYPSSGFLVAPDVVMTNYHVMEKFLPKDGHSPQKDPADLVLRFDFEVASDGVSVPGLPRAAFAARSGPDLLSALQLARRSLPVSSQTP